MWEKCLSKLGNEMKSSLTTPTGVLSPTGFPKLMGYDRFGMKFIVLFTERSKGIVVFSESDKYPVGYSNEHWSECHFSLFQGTVTLENE